MREAGLWVGIRGQTEGGREAHKPKETKNIRSAEPQWGVKTEYVDEKKKLIGQKTIISCTRGKTNKIGKVSISREGGRGS